MKSLEDSYDCTARYYDEAYGSKEDLTDLPFYLELAEKVGGPILEIGCGTGRALMPIARKGIEIEGLDASQTMLEVLKSALKLEAERLQFSVHVHHQDMRNFDLKKKFKLVTIPFRPMQHMYNLSDQIAALTMAKKHMTDDGRLAFDVFFPKYEVIFSGVGDEVVNLEWKSELNNGKLARMYFRKEFVDKVNQFFTGKFIYRTYENERVIKEEIDPIKMSYYTYPHLLSLFQIVGLEIVEQYGSFTKEPLDNSAKQMIFVLKHKS